MAVLAGIALLGAALARSITKADPAPGAPAPTLVVVAARSDTVPGVVVDGMIWQDGRWHTTADGRR